MAGLRLIVGLGNPGPEHLRTRHNAGFWLVDALALREGARFGLESKLFGETCKVVIAGQPVWLLKPATFMNASGKSVAAAMPALVSALNRVDLPTFGRPTMPHWMPMVTVCPYGGASSPR